MKKFFSAVAIVVALNGPAHAQDYNKGWDAFFAGDCPSSGFLGPRAAYSKREFGSSGWFDYAACWR
jgi:hypothetical protein